jgi:glycolate oxidase
MTTPLTQHLDAGHIQALMAIVGFDAIKTGDEIALEYARDELVLTPSYPDAVVEPATTQQVQAIMRYANMQRIPVTVRGAGTGLCGGSVPVHGGIVLSTARMNRVLEIDRECMTATVEPGVLLLDFQKQVEKLGLFYPPDPGEKSATLGGNISTNAGGMRAVKYGVTRDYVRGLEVVLANGEVIHLGGKLAKNSSGYNLVQLLVGSEGTLGVVTKIILRLIPLPAFRMSLLVPFPSLATAIAAVPAILNAGVAPTALEFFQDKVLQAFEENMGKPFPHRGSPAYLLIMLDSNAQANLDAAYEATAEVCLQHQATDVLIADTTERYNALWEARGSFLQAIKAMSEIDEADVVTPIARIAEFIMFCDSLAEEYGVRIYSFGHAGDGNGHVYLLRDAMTDTVWQQRQDEVMRIIYKKGAELGGAVSGEHGIGRAKRIYLHDQVGETQMRLMRQIKQAFDPEGILNPGKVI